MTENRILISYNLQFFAKDGPGGEKTEPATSKKLNDVRKEGQVAKSKDIDNNLVSTSKIAQGNTENERDVYPAAIMHLKMLSLNANFTPTKSNVVVTTIMITAEACPCSPR